LKELKVGYHCVKSGYPFPIFIESKGGTAIEATSLLQRHGPITGDFFYFFDIFNDDLELVVAVTELEEALEDDTLEG
jgi:hypothetical protein